MNTKYIQDILADFLETLALEGFTYQIHNSKTHIYYQECAICSLNLYQEANGYRVYLNKAKGENNIGKKKGGFKRYWVDNIPTKEITFSANNKSNLDNLLYIIKDIKKVFFEDIVVDFQIETMKFKDYRCFRNEQFHFNRESTVLVGKNGSGKTSLLEGVAIAISSFLRGIDEPTDSKTITKEDIRFSSYQEEGVPIYDYHPPTVLSYQTRFLGKRIQWSRARNSLTSTRITTKESNNVTNIVRQIVEDIRSENKERKIVLPVFSYHGTGRVANFTKDMGILEKMERISRFVGYRDCLKAASNYKFFLAWYRKMKLREFELQIKIPSLDAVTTSIMKCLNMLTDKEDYCINKILFFEGDIHVQDNYNRLTPISCLSDGYQDVIGIISDIAYRMAILNPHLGNEVLIETPGIVLIDEVDLHLHPRWQQRILHILKKIFPKVQFITTTHSAIIISSTNKDEAVELYSIDGYVKAKAIGNPREWYISDILSQAFHLDKKPLYANNMGSSLDDRMIRFNDYIKEYLLYKNDNLKNKIKELYYELLPSLPEDTPKRRAIDSLWNLVQ